MPHLVESLPPTTFDNALQGLAEAHLFLVSRAKAAITSSAFDESNWGVSVKRSPVDLTGVSRPGLIGKSSEQLGEVINIAATIERLIDAIKWFKQQDQSGSGSIFACHPSTSGEANGNDLVIVNGAGQVVARCEVCDVASTRAGSNGKEKKDLRNLRCDQAVPQDGVRRYICTSPEFARSITGSRRPWARWPYRYRLIETGSAAGTCMLLIEPAEPAASLQ